jgi:uncharacterized protein YndB with AHSA1/START domain
MADTTSSWVARQELFLTRIYGAPCSLVFKAWTDPKHVARWWVAGSLCLRIVSR